jgi:hypothetical protein
MPIRKAARTALAQYLTTAGHGGKSVARACSGRDDGRVIKPKLPLAVSVAVADRAARQQTGLGVPAVTVPLS